jgi:endonuclease III
MSARINSSISVEAARNLAKRGWRTPEKLAASTWEQRVKALNEAGYTRYQERTATMLGDLADQLRERYGGDLRKLREEAERDPKAERRLLKQFKGLGDARGRLRRCARGRQGLTLGRRPPPCNRC